MSFNIQITKSAKKQLQHFPKADQQRIKPQIDGLGQTPKPVGCKKLKGVDELYRIRSGDYRIIYQLKEEQLIILILRIGHRKDIYQNL